MPRRIFPAGTVTNTTGAPLRLTFYANSTTNRRETDLWTVDSSSNLSAQIPNGVILADSSGAYSAFAGPDDMDTLYLNSHTGSSRSAISYSGSVASGHTGSTTLNVRDFGAKGDGTTDDTTAIQAALTGAKSAGGGIVYFPVGTYKVTTALLVQGAAQTDSFDNGGITLRGESQRGTKLVGVGAISLLKIGDGVTTKVMCHVENMELKGPGLSTSGSTGIDWVGTAGSYRFENVYIHDFDCGVRLYDCTLGSMENVNVRLCTTGLALAYNCDIHTFIGCRFDYCTDAVVIGQQSVAHNTGDQEINAVTFIGCRISNNTARAIFVNDYAAQGITFRGCYFESNVKEGELGVNARGETAGATGVVFDGCFFTPVLTQPVAVGFDVYNRASLRFIDCMTDASNHYTIFVRLNDNLASAILDGCRIGAATAAVQTAGGVNYNDSGTVRETLVVEARPRIVMGDAGYAAANAALQSFRLANGTGKTIEEWGRINGATGAFITQMKAYDVGGVLRLEGITAAFLAATPVASLPTAGVNYRGCIARVDGAAGVADLFYICQKSAADTYSWKLLSTG